jgi:hypothetical protein
LILTMNFSSCCHQSLNNLITIYMKITAIRNQIKLVATLIFPLSQSGNDWRGRRRLRQNRVVCFSHFEYRFKKYFKKDLKGHCDFDS